jgi:hypothetical protein
MHDARGSGPAAVNPVTDTGPRRAQRPVGQPQEDAVTRWLIAALIAAAALPAAAQEVARYGAYCINGRMSVEQWDLRQMQVRHGSNVCQFSSATNVSDMQTFIARNFPTGRCSCN